MSQSGHWARSLRVIGQEISKFTPIFLEIELRGNIFVVQGTYVVRERDVAPSAVRNVLKSWLKLLEKYPEEDAGRTPLRRFEIRYTPEDIRRLDEKWAGMRGKGGKTPDIYSYSELLRTIGRQLDSDESQLLKITKEDRSFIVRFRDAEGNVKSHECSLLALYKKQQDMISQRGTTKMKDLWEYYDL